ncbi:MAG TPA: hypothetical protein VD903_15300 [Pseudonocardia sp.]|nr:hypothetical protein [Pseudonocardia sp.]
MSEPAIAVSDRPMAPHQYRYVETHAWWLGTFGPHQHLTEHRLRQWVPARPEREWVLERELTGAQTWLTGSAEEARADGFDLRGIAPVGRFRAPYGDFDAGPDAELGTDLDSALCARPRPPRRGSWQSPTPEFLQRLPRDPEVLLGRLREDNPGSWFGPFAAAVTALRTVLVPAELRAAFFRALAALPGVRVGDEAVNVDGHSCVAIVHDAGRTRTELLLDPADGQFAGERDTLRADSRVGLPAGTVISTTAVRTAVVDAAGELPAT